MTCCNPLNALLDITILSQSTDLGANFDCQLYFKPLIYISANKSNVASLGAPNLLLYKLTWHRILCIGNGAISHLQTEMGFVEDFCYSLYN